MKRFIVSLVLVLAGIGTNVAQNLEDKTIITVNNTAVSVGEFLGVYKKNLELVTDQKQKELDNYLNLYIDYKLKVAEAYDRQLDTSKTHKDEYRLYKHKLATNYMAARKVTDTLIQEAYERNKEQILARHILIDVSPDALPQDTLAAYNRISKLREEIVKGSLNFDVAARANSSDPSAADTGGNLGWFTVFSMVYQFETVAYNTPVGEISPVFRTQFGYHIIEVLGRRAMAKEVTAAHIMITPKKDDPNFDPEAIINELYSNLQQGASFSELAKQFSDDKNTAVNGGELKRFGPGQLNAENFEQQAFSLKNPGDYSKPFKTAYGWHIVKLIQRYEFPSYEEMIPRLKQRVEQANRLDYIKSVTKESLKERYNIKSSQEVIPFFTNFLTDSITKKTWVYADSTNPAMKRVLFKLPVEEITYHDFAKFIEERQTKSRRYDNTAAAAKGFYEEFELTALREYFKDHLDLEDKEFAKIVREYKEGLLIFDLMESAIWNKVKDDTLGLEAFYNANKNNYKFKERISGIIAVGPDKTVLNQIRSKFKKGVPLSELKAEFAQDNKVQVIFTEGTFEVDSRKLPEDFKVKKGVSKLYNTNKQFTVVLVEEVIPVSVKPLNTIRGQVMGDYQAKLEAGLMVELKEKFPVSVNKEVLEEIKQQL